MDKSYFLIIPLVLIAGTVVYVGYFLAGLDNFLKFLFMPDCAHPLILLGFIGLYYIYKGDKTKMHFNVTLSYICALLISVGFSSLIYAFYIRNFSEYVSLLCHFIMIGVGFFVFSKNIKKLRIRGHLVAGFFLALDAFSDLFWGTKHPYIYSNQDIINGFIIRIICVLLLMFIIFYKRKSK